MIALCEPSLTGRESKYVLECIRTNWVSSAGKFVDRLEDEFAQWLERTTKNDLELWSQETVIRENQLLNQPGSWVGVQNAVAVASGTAALHLALLAIGVRQDDEVLVSDLTFIAPANAIRYVGAWPIFIDAEPDYWQMDISQVQFFLENQCEYRRGNVFNKLTERRVAAVLPVHVLGHPVKMDELVEICNAFGLPIIEDATEGLGATASGRPVGTLGTVGCFSFNGNKLLTTGGGGMVISSDPEIAQRVRYLSTQAKDSNTEYIHHEVGYNYRLSNIQAALGCAQLEQVTTFLKKKRQIARFYQQNLADIAGLSCMAEANWASSAWWLFTILIDETLTGISSRVLIQKLAEKGISSRPLWQPLHASPAHISDIIREKQFPIAEQLYAQAISLPSSVSLCEEDLRYICTTLVENLKS